jgi:hypothetical protein
MHQGAIRDGIEMSYRFSARPDIEQCAFVVVLRDGKMRGPVAAPPLDDWRYSAFVQNIHLRTPALRTFPEAYCGAGAASFGSAFGGL